MSEADRAHSPLETLCQQVSALTDAVQKLQEGYTQIDGCLQQLAGPSILPTSTPAPTSGASSPQVSSNPMVIMAAPEPRVPTPEQFSGDRKKFRAFKNACSLYLALQPRTFSSEVVKVGFIISLLADEPQAWAHSLMEQRRPVLNTVDTFFESMGQLYDDPQCMATQLPYITYLKGEGRLRTIRLSSGSGRLIPAGASLPLSISSTRGCLKFSRMSWPGWRLLLLWRI